MQGWFIEERDIHVKDPGTSVIGRGSFGVVYRAHFHGSEVACKVIRYAAEKKSEIDGFIGEIALMTMLHQCATGASCCNLLHWMRC